MRCVRWTEQGIELTEAKAPRLRPGWVRLEVAANGICGTDVHLHRRELPPLVGNVPGHEIVGVPLDGPKDLAQALYAVEPLSWCGACDRCSAGRRHLCSHLQVIGIHLPGGLADSVDLPLAGLHPLPPSVSPLIGSLSEPLAVAIRAVNLSRLESSSRVLVLGAGTIGLLCGLLARDRAVRTAITARHPHQRKAAEDLGIEVVREDDALAWAAEAAPDVVIETVGGHADTLTEAVNLCAAAGRIIVVGVFGGSRPLNALLLMLKELTLIGSNTYGTTGRGSEFRSAVELMPRYQSELAPLLTHQFPLESTEAALRCASDKTTGSLKVSVVAGG